MPGHVRDRWTSPGPNGRRIRNDRWGKGRRWQARWTDRAGREHALTFTTKDAADVHLRSVDLRATPQPAQAVTFGVYASHWLESQLHHRAQTADTTARTFRNMLQPQLGDKLLDEIDRADVQAAVATWSKTYAPSHVEIAYGYVATIYRHAVQDRLVQFSPCVRISLPAIVRAPLVPLTADQVAMIADRVPKHYRQMAILTAATGLRSGEVRGLTVDRVLAGTQVRVDRQLIGKDGARPLFGPPKSDAGFRTLNISEVARRALEVQLSTYTPGVEGIIFTGRTGRPLSRSDVGDVWRTATAGMGLRPRSGWHDLRHYCASLLIAGGLSVRAVADWLGHKDPAETLRTYAHWWPADQTRITAAIDGELGGLFESPEVDGPETDQP